MPILESTDEKKLPDRPQRKTFCDHCGRIRLCTQVRTPFTMWLCDEAMTARRATPTGTISSADVEAFAVMQYDIEEPILDPETGTTTADLREP